MTLKEIRMTKHLSMKAVAAMIDIDTSMMSRIEGMTHAPSLKTARKIAKLYGVSLDTVYAGIQENAADGIETLVTDQ